MGGTSGSIAEEGAAPRSGLRCPWQTTGLARGLMFARRRDLCGVRALIVDDNAGNREILTTRMALRGQEAGGRCRTALCLWRRSPTGAARKAILTGLRRRYADARHGWRSA